MVRLVAASLTVDMLVVVVAARSVPKSGKDDGALYLTPMIRHGRVDDARAACVVQLPNATAVLSCSGYLTVNETYGSNMFFWFFPAMSGAADAPVVLWLQGGPGASSLFSVFNEHGPFSVGKTHGLKLRNHTWTATHSVLYVDNPVGTGYSFTGHDDGYSTNQTAVGLNLYETLVQFFELFPEYRNNDFYAAGESYAGKYVPAVSYTIHQKNQDARFKINLKGLAIGNGLIDPVNQMVYSEFLYQLGFVDENEKRKFAALEDSARDQMVAGDFEAAYGSIKEMMVNYPSLYYNLTSMPTSYNVLWNRNPIPYLDGDWNEYVQRPEVRGALHVGRRGWASVLTVFDRLKYDIPRSVSGWLAALLDAGRYRVLLYSGHLDVIVPYRSTVRVARALRWSGADMFANATRTVWRVPVTTESVAASADHCCDVTDVAGYATAYGPLTVLMIRNAGHMASYDQPAWAHEMIVRFTSGKPFK